MTNDLLAFVLALQHFEIPKDLQQLANNCKARNWRNIKSIIEDTLMQYPKLKGFYQSIYSQLQQLNNEQLNQLLPNAQKLEQFKPKRLETLGRTPAISSEKNNEVENLVVEIAIIILQHDKPSEMSKEILPNNPISKDNQKS